jgi:hypothetical protein
VSKSALAAALGGAGDDDGGDGKEEDDPFVGPSQIFFFTCPSQIFVHRRTEIVLLLLLRVRSNSMWSNACGVVGVVGIVLCWDQTM